MFRTQSVVLAVATLFIISPPASATTMKEFRRFSPEEQSMYVVAAVNMLAYNYAATGNVTKASCIKKGMFGDRKGGAAPGVREITIEAGVASNLDAEKYHIEGVILGAVDKACSLNSSQRFNATP